ncbi:MAG TPA: glycosyl hydrolase-related protein [Planctomycetota bacterium]|nr:glycosyl hydrolase-related protein [Planctomycetota bacterium]
MRRPFLGGCAFALLSLTARAQTPTVYIACDDHTDYFWTADDVAYRKAFLRTLDYFLDQIDKTADDPPDFQARYACDGALWLWEYERHRPHSDFLRLVARMKDGHVSAPMTAAVSCYGGMPVEAALRGMYYAGRLERRFGLRFDLAVAMENQTLPYGLASVWAGAGARYSWRGICDCATKVPDAWDREHDAYWAQGPDGARVLMKWNSMLVSNEAMGGYAEARDPFAIVDYVTGDPAFKQRWPYSVIGAFGKGWDDYMTLTADFPKAAKAKSDATRRVVVSNELDFFRDFETRYGAGLPTVATSFGNEWDLLCATMAEVSASVRRSLATLRSAEALAAIACIHNPDFMKGRFAARDQAFMDLGLYWEHDWTANGPVPASARAAWQRQLAAEIAAYADGLLADAAAALGRHVALAGANPRFAVFNPLSFERDDVADLPYVPTAAVHVVDVASGHEVPVQLFTLNGAKQLRILAKDVPAVGYRVYEVVPGAGKTYTPAATVNGGVIDNGVCKVTLASDGAIASFVDLRHGGRELVDVGAGLRLDDLGGNGSGSLKKENAGPASVTLVATSNSPLKHATRVTLVRDSDVVRIENEIQQNFGNVQTWTFGFDLPGPDTRHEEVGAIAAAHLQSAGGVYSERNARYDWLTLGHFADMTSARNGIGCTLANLDCSFFQLGRSDVGRLDDLTPRITVLAGGSIDGLGIVNQDGDTTFRQRFALRTHGAYDPTRAMQTALAAETPFVVAAVTGTHAKLPADTFAFLDVSDPDVLLWALKPAEEGGDEGTIVRLWNVSELPQTATLQLHPKVIQSATATTHLETDVGSLSVAATGVDVDFATQQIRTVRLRIR